MGKRGITLNLAAESGREHFLRLVKDSAPTYLPSLGLGWEALHKANTRLVMASITPSGSTGPTGTTGAKTSACTQSLAKCTWRASRTASR